MTPRLTSERLLLRPHTRDDLRSSVNLFTDPEVMGRGSDGVMCWSATTDIFRKVFGIEEHDEHEVWAVFTREDGRYIGSAELKPRGGGEVEIVHVLGRPYWDMGYAAEIARLLVSYAFDQLGRRRVTAVVDLENATAIRLLEELGFRRIGEGIEQDETALIYGVDNPQAALAEGSAGAEARPGSVEA